MTDPGPAPTPLVFPEAEARALDAAIDRLIGTLDRALTVHRDAHASELQTLLGPERERFDADLRTRLARLQQHQQELSRQRERIRGALISAEAAITERRAARQRWEHDVRAHREAQEVGR